MERGSERLAQQHLAQRALDEVTGHLQRRALKLAAGLLVLYAMLKPIPALAGAAHPQAGIVGVGARTACPGDPVRERLCLRVEWIDSAPGRRGEIGGMAGMLILYGVDHDPALAAVLSAKRSD